MPDMIALCKWLEQTSIGASIRQSLWLFPALETVHLLGMAALISTVTVFDLRLLGCTMKDKRVSDLAHRLLPWSWAAFAVQVVTGILLFSSEAVKVYINPAFRLKMLFIAFAGAQALLFHQTTYRKVSAWDESPALPTSAKLTGAVSILLWMAVVAAGRFIGFV
jgi:hypothetical protein